jgi:prolyl 4-hydroxylase
MREQSPILDAVFKRAAEVLKLSDSMLHPRTNTENLQVVRYEPGEFYAEHYDWSQNRMPWSRYITLLLYLNDFANQTSSASIAADGSSSFSHDTTGDEDGDDGRLHEGGETAFFRANNGKGLAIHPGQGSAVLFYNLLEDGNGDEMTLHASLPVKRGVKWLANLWVWDPSVPPKDLQDAAVTEEDAGYEDDTASETNETGATD